MMLSLRLMRFGAKGQPAYRVVVIDSKKPRESKAKAIIGSYNPLTDPAEIKIDLAKAKYWMDRGAKPSETVKSLLAKPQKATPKT
ncbi:MAG: 30S ribosomal protein S16 [Acidobacteriota bacterium]|nr:30S ribosomal protein S16 [Acidobacteriota bacterium]HNQ80559.1 30S ribosomal protein S16 [Candidatus Aminicenantes bacterium]MDD8032901.1 30S ribosomal protein S16 [Acidobacteriota bacterium]MDW3226180.1 30S ribosomal protein S16 [Acidobacteriota bacterium]HOF81956.1 30S ribosomal protein S16 [Candidatus Aminicenantes bacterium]